MKHLIAASIAMASAACASQPAPTQQIATALAAVRGAEEVGARSIPQAALHLQLAEEQVQRARELMEDEKNGRAHTLAVRAYQDAELALALARENAERQRLERFVSNHPTTSDLGSAPGAPESAPASEQPAIQ